MSSDQVDGFADNWAYLKTELRWLDQVLMLAVTRQRKEITDIERISQSKADRATSAWWKGIISTEGKAVYDEHRQPAQPPKGGTYQQQLESKIQATFQKNVYLALPALRDRLRLTQFEKNLVLMSLAPEINRRYARLYRYLQGEDTAGKTDLPTLDLVLRLLCRNDEEWRTARQRLVSTSPLLQHNLLQWSTSNTDSLLNTPLKLAGPLVNYLLTEMPTAQDLEFLLRQVQPTRKALLKHTVMAVEWSELVLPAPLLASLQYLTQRLQGYNKAEEVWSFQSPGAAVPLGTIALLVGEAGTGKTLAAAATARALQTALVKIDLALIDPADYPNLLQEILTKTPKILLLKSAHLWFGRLGALSAVEARKFFEKRKQIAGITFLSVQQVSGIQVQWRQQADHTLQFSKPNAVDRLRLWQQAFAAAVPLSLDLDWETLAHKLPLTGKEIMTIAQDAILYAAANEASTVEMHHLIQALAQRGKKLSLPVAPVATVAIEPSHTPPRKRKTGAKRLTQPEASPIQLPATDASMVEIDQTLEQKVEPINKSKASTKKSNKKQSSIGGSV